MKVNDTINIEDDEAIDYIYNNIEGKVKDKEVFHDVINLYYEFLKYKENNC